MPRPTIDSTTTMTELAAIVSEALETAGIVATRSGGSAVSIYTENRYESEDLDFVTTALLQELKPVLEPLGFVHTGSPRLSVFEHPATDWYLEFPPAPLSFGATYIDASRCTVLSTSRGNIRIITATHSVMDRLIAAASWQDAPSLEQALLVARHQADSIDWSEIDTWVVAEGSLLQGGSSSSTAPPGEPFRYDTSRLNRRLEEDVKVVALMGLNSNPVWDSNRIYAWLHEVADLKAMAA